MDILICGTCHGEFNNIENFMEHKKLKSYACTQCDKLFHTEEDVDQHTVKEHSLILVDNQNKNNLSCCNEDPIGISAGIDNNDSAREVRMEMEDLGTVTFIPDEEGNITLMGNIQIVQSIGNPSVVAVNSVQEIESETTINNTVLTLQSPEFEKTTEQNDVFNSFSVEDNKQLDGIFACSLCQCFALTQGEIVNHIQNVHKVIEANEPKEYTQFFTRLEPLKAKHQSTQECFEGQVSGNLKMLPVSSNSSMQKADAIHLVVETISDKDTLIPSQNGNNRKCGQRKRKRGRPRKSENQKEVQMNPQTCNKETDCEPVPELGCDGQYHCLKCKRAFKKERHFRGHKCLGVGDYIDFSLKENPSVTSEEITEEMKNILEADDDLKDVDTDVTENFKVYMPVDNPPWSRGRRGGGRNRNKGKERGQEVRNIQNEESEENGFQTENCEGNKENHALISIVIEKAENVSVFDVENEITEFPNEQLEGKPKTNWRNDPHHIPVFSTEDERIAFEEQLNAVDLSCVDHLYIQHEVAQDVDLSRSYKMTGKETNELIMFSCSVCKKVFKSLSHMRLHCLIHTDLKPFKCPQCQFQSNAKGNLYTHMRKHTGNYFKCSQCNFRSLNRSHLAEHEAIHSSKSRQCKLCHNYYNTVKSLMNHVRKYHTSAAGKHYLSTFLAKSQHLMALLHICYICNRKFKKKADRDRHLFIHNIHNNYPNVFRCNLCDYTSSRRSYLENHRRRHRLVFVCYLCKNMFISTVPLRSHLQNHINENSVNFQPSSDNSSPTLSQSIILKPSLDLESSEIISSDNISILCQNDDENLRTAANAANILSVEKFPSLKILTKENNSDWPLKRSLNTFSEDNTLDFLFEKSLNSSWYLPEPDGSVILNQFINLPEELREGQEQNDSTEGLVIGNTPTITSDESNNSAQPNFNVITSLNYKPLTVQIYQKIQQSFGTMECESCGRLFHSSIDLEAHRLTHSENKPFKCDKCSYNAASKETLKRHQESVHEGRRTFACDQCDFVASSRTNFWHHRQKHLTTSHCGLCNESFTTLHTLRNHIRSKHPNIDKAEFQKLLGNNRRIVGRLGRCSYKCPYCNRIFRRSSADLQKHIWIHEGIKPYKCTVCSHTCRTRNNLKIHMLRHSSDKPHLCEECGKSYKSKTALKCHIKTHFIDGLFHCEQCNYTTNQKSHLKQHMESHKILQGYRCEHCDYSSSTVEFMKVHYSHKHKGETFIEKSNYLVSVESQDQVYKCFSCDCLFGSITETKQHLKIQHGITETIGINVEETRQFETDKLITTEEENVLFNNNDITIVDSTQEEVEMVEIQENTFASNLQRLQLTSLTDGEIDEKTANAVNLIQQIIGQGTIESQVTLHSVDGQSLVAVNPETIIVQENGHELLLDGTNTDEQYVIQYVTDPTTASADAEVTVQTCEDIGTYENIENQMEIEYCSIEPVQQECVETSILEQVDEQESLS